MEPREPAAPAGAVGGGIIIMIIGLFQIWVSFAVDPRHPHVRHLQSVADHPKLHRAFGIIFVLVGGSVVIAGLVQMLTS